MGDHDNSPISRIPPKQPHPPVKPNPNVGKPWGGGGGGEMMGEEEEEEEEEVEGYEDDDYYGDYGSFYFYDQVQ